MLHAVCDAKVGNNEVNGAAGQRGIEGAVQDGNYTDKDDEALLSLELVLVGGTIGNVQLTEDQLKGSPGSSWAKVIISVCSMPGTKLFKVRFLITLIGSFGAEISWSAIVVPLC